MTPGPALTDLLRPHREAVLPVLVKEAATCFPPSLAALEGWRPPWEEAAAPPEPRPPADLGPDEAAARALLRAHPESLDALARLLGLEPRWEEVPAAGSEDAVGQLLAEHPEATQALAALLAGR